MHFILFSLASLWFIYIAPPTVAIAVVASVVLVMAVIYITAKFVIGGTSLYEAFKAICYAFGFLALGLVTLLSLGHSTGDLARHAFVAIAGLPFLFASYVLGFKLALQATLGASVVVALVSTVVSALLFLGYRSYFL